MLAILHSQNNLIETFDRIYGDGWIKSDDRVY